jgi:hypothetical protein
LIKVKENKPEELKKNLLDKGYSSSVAEKIVAMYASPLEDF